MDIKIAKELFFAILVTVVLYYFYVGVPAILDINQFNKTYHAFMVNLSFYTQWIVDYNFYFRFLAVIAGFHFAIYFISSSVIFSGSNSFWKIIGVHLLLAFLILIGTFLGLYLPVISLGRVV